MNSSSSRYDEAAKKYQSRIKENPFKAEIDDLIRFVNSEEWEPALRMLKASGRSIKLGIAQGAHSSVEFGLYGDGFYVSHRENDWKREVYISSSSHITEEKTEVLAKAFRNHITNSASFDDILHLRLDGVAESCPK